VDDQYLKMAAPEKNVRLHKMLLRARNPIDWCYCVQKIALFAADPLEM